MNNPIKYDFFGRESTVDHTVEDTRSARKKGKNKEKRKKNRPAKSKTLLLTVMITILCFSLTLVAADLIGGDAGIVTYTSLFFKKKNHSKTFYAVYATHSTDMTLSYKNAATIREEGGAGYVLKRESHYYVLLNLYENKKDAQSVAERRQNYGTIELEVFDLDVKKQPALSPAENSKNLYQEVYKTLYQAANDLASAKYQKQDMLRQLRAYKEKVVAAENAYAESIKGNEEQITIEYKVLLAEIRSAFENLEHDQTHLVSDARYYSIMIIRSFADFSQKYFK